ncbi:hypothetical protein BAG01nite_16410 [Brevibacillus agri]|uniref:DUF397 domain-containing protein n=1 Tax=Brevibacillus agri TaxID=51101 RepID=A0ABQ0SNQ3_9BACL|nr:hypothetical protein BAG01nite_16410 [Brevibacillus agri]
MGIVRGYENPYIRPENKRLLVRVVAQQQRNACREAKRPSHGGPDECLAAAIYAADAGANRFASELDSSGGRRKIPFAHLRLG